MDDFFFDDGREPGAIDLVGDLPASSSRSISIHFIPIDKLQAALPRDEVVQAALLGRDRQPIPRHTVEYSPFDVVQTIVRVNELDGAESGIDEPSAPSSRMRCARAGSAR